MPASLILRLARTRRCATVGSGTRKARAISGVCSPAISRRVSAIRASGASAGWQQVKMRRSWSSATGPTSVSGSGSPMRATASASLPGRVDSRRSRSSALCRAVVTIQPPGLGGRPSDGQRSTATAKASWTASSARSMSPKTRARVATARPELSRKTRATTLAPGALPPGAPPSSGAPAAAGTGPGIMCSAPAPVTRRPARPGTDGPRPGGRTPPSRGRRSPGPRPGRRP